MPAIRALLVPAPIKPKDMIADCRTKSKQGSKNKKKKRDDNLDFTFYNRIYHCDFRISVMT